jgi:phosphatidylserine/phosphatidylglycerophosphate/cardiolipin synthase-like enzyme
MDSNSGFHRVRMAITQQMLVFPLDCASKIVQDAGKRTGSLHSFLHAESGSPRGLPAKVPGGPGVRRASVHAKLIVADEATIDLGSANFTTAAFQRNIEAGIRLDSASLGSITSTG